MNKKHILQILLNAFSSVIYFELETTSASRREKIYVKIPFLFFWRKCNGKIKTEFLGRFHYIFS